MLTITHILVLLSLVFTLVAAVGRLPLWPAVLLLVLDRMLTLWPR